MLEWALLIGLAVNDPEATEIARYATESECRRAEKIVWLYAEKAAAERGKDQPADVYASCKKGTHAAAPPGSAR